MTLPSFISEPTSRWLGQRSRAIGLAILAAVVALGMNGLFAAPANASLIVPQAPQFSFDETSASSMSSDQGTDSGSSDSADESPTESAKRLLPSEAMPPGGASSTTTTSFGSVGGPLGLDSAVTPLDGDLALAGWVAGELRFSLPSPPGNDLLRPPRQ